MLFPATCFHPRNVIHACADVLGYGHSCLAWQECVVRKRSHPVEQQQRALPQKEFDGWMVVAERATNRFAHLLFALTCWRNLVSQRRGGARSTASGEEVVSFFLARMHREEVVPRAERGFRMRLSGSATGDEDGWSGSGASGHDGPPEEDDLPGMSDTGESDAELAENCDRSWIQALDEEVRRRKMQESKQQRTVQRGEPLIQMHSALLCRQSQEEGKQGRRNVLSRTKNQGHKMSLTETLSALLVAEERAKLLDQKGDRVSGASASPQSRARGAGPTSPRRAASDSQGPSSLSSPISEFSQTKRYPPTRRYTALERCFSSKECCKESPPAILGIWESPEQAATAFGREDEGGSGSEGAVALHEFVSSLSRLSRASRDTTGSSFQWHLHA